MKSRTRRVRPVRSAFTLVELLVAITIIALLVAILLPSMRQARKQAKAVKCSSNLRNLGQALQMYASEYNGWIPRDIQGTSIDVPFAVPLAWELKHTIDIQANLRDQLLKVEILQCPDFPRHYKTALGTPMPEQPLDYVVNGFPKDYVPDPSKDTLLESPDPTARWNMDANVVDPPQQLSEIRNIGGVIYLTETHGMMLTANYSLHDVWRGAHLPRGLHPRVATDRRHPGGINALFFDTHVEPRPPEKLEVTDFYFAPGAVPQDTAN